MTTNKVFPRTCSAIRTELGEEPVDQYFTDKAEAQLTRLQEALGISTDAYTSVLTKWRSTEQLLHSHEVLLSVGQPE